MIKLLQHKSVLQNIVSGNALGEPPIHVRIEPTESCNFRCRFCWWHDSERKKTIAATADMTGKRHIDRERLIQLVDELAELGTQAVSFTGAGDPLVYPRLYEVIARLHENKIAVGVTSNMAMPLKDKAIEALARSAWLRWSLNAGLDDGYIKINQPSGNNSADAFARAKSNIRQVVEKRDQLDSQLVITVSYVVTDGNQGEISDAVALAAKLGIDAIAFRPDTHYERGHVAADIADNFAATIKSIQSEYAEHPINIYSGMGRKEDNLEVKEPGLLCFYSNHSSYIAATGDVYPCCYTRHEKRYAIGNINESSLETFWYSDIRKQNYAQLDMQDCPSCPHGEANRVLKKLYAGDFDVDQAYENTLLADPFV